MLGTGVLCRSGHNPKGRTEDVEESGSGPRDRAGDVVPPKVLLLDERGMKMAMGISNRLRLRVFDFGQRTTLGAPAEVIGDEAVVAAYLGAA